MGTPVAFSPVSQGGLPEIPPDCTSQDVICYQNPRPKIAVLPPEMLSIIFAFLDKTTLLTVARRVCRFWNSVINSNFFWKRVCQEVWPALYETEKRNLQFNWKEQIFRQLHLPKWPFFSTTVPKRWKANERPIRAYVLGDCTVRPCPHRAHKVLYTAGTDNLINAYNTRTGKLIRQFSGHTNHVRCLHLTHDYLFSGARDQKLKMWDLLTMQCVKTFTLPIEPDKIYTSKDFAVVVPHVGSLQDRIKIRVYSLETTKLIKLHTVAIANSLDVNVANDCLFYGAENGSVRQVNLATGDEVREFVIPRETYDTCIIRIKIVANFLLTSTFNGVVRTWDIDRGTCLHSFNHDSGFCGVAQLDPKLICLGGTDGTVTVINKETWKIHHIFKLFERAVSWMKMEHYTLYAYDNSRVAVCDLMHKTHVLSPAYTNTRVLYEDGTAILANIQKGRIKSYRFELSAPA